MSSPLPVILETLVDAYHRGRGLVLLFDYDGTLVPLVDHPQLAHLDSETRRILEGLAQQPRVTVGILSGRALENLKQMVPVTGIWLVGSGGLEMELGETRWVHPRAVPESDVLGSLSRQLQDVLTSYRGVWVEEKALGLTVHYRDVAPAEVSVVRAVVARTVETLGGQLMAVDGAKAIEITPALNWTKGSIVRLLVERTDRGSCLPLYAGDEANDREALETVSALGGFAIGVGENVPETARHLLSDSAALRRFLGSVLDGLTAQARDAPPDEP